MSDWLRFSSIFICLVFITYFWGILPYCPSFEASSPNSDLRRRGSRDGDACVNIWCSDCLYKGIDGERVSFDPTAITEFLLVCIFLISILSLWSFLGEFWIYAVLHLFGTFFSSISSVSILLTGFSANLLSLTFRNESIRPVNWRFCEFSWLFATGYWESKKFIFICWCCEGKNFWSPPKVAVTMYCFESVVSFMPGDALADDISSSPLFSLKVP